MRIGVSTRVFADETEGAFSKIESSGADCADVYLRTFYEYRPEFAKKLKKGGEGLEVSSLRAQSENFELNLLSSDRRIRGDGLYWLDQVLRAARYLGAKRFVMDFSGLSNRVEEPDFSGILNACEAYGTGFLISNAFCGLVFRPTDFHKLKERCPALKGALDMREARKSCRPYQMYISAFGESLEEAFVSDVSEKGPCLPGEGRTDFAELFSRLADKGFCGDVIVDGPCRADAERLERSIEFLKDMAEKAGL